MTENLKKSRASPECPEHEVAVTCPNCDETFLVTVNAPEPPGPSPEALARMAAETVSPEAERMAKLYPSLTKFQWEDLLEGTGAPAAESTPPPTTPEV